MDAVIWLDSHMRIAKPSAMEAKTDPNIHLLEIPLASNGSAKWIIRAPDVAQLVKELTEAAAAIETIAQLAGRIVAVTCGVPLPNTKGAS
ncbi:MAG TPA: hypothetical protein VHT91_12995 [Kofleriaceae bacterium]|jgi:hypothetical protein|nr:hypothetical protein [Kofleriaceae bacterium]